MRRRSVLLLTHHFPPSRAVGGQRALRWARYLPDHGYDVEVVCAMPPEGREGSDRDLLRAIPPDLHVHRLPVRFFLGRDPSSVPGRDAPLQRVFWKMRAYLDDVMGPAEGPSLWARDARAHVQRLLATRQYDVMIVSGPPFSAALEAIALRRASGIPLVTDFRDLWVSSVMTREPGGAVYPMREAKLRRLLALERRILEESDGVLLTNQAALERILETCPHVNRDKFGLVTNAYDEELTDSAPPASSHVLPPHDGITFLHAGQLEYGRDIAATTLLRALKALTGEPGVTPLRVCFAGAPAETIRRIAWEGGATDIVHDLGYLSRAQSLQLQRQVDVLVVLQADLEGNRYCVPAKLFEYMTAGRPILGVLPEGPASSIVIENELGAVGAWDDPASVRTALLHVLNRVAMREEPRPPAQFAAGATVRRLAAFLNDLVSDRPPMRQSRGGTSPPPPRRVRSGARRR